MFGAEPDLFCEKCANQVRKRMAPSPIGRTMSVFGGRPTPITAYVLGAAAVLFLFSHVIFTSRAEPAWLMALYPYGPTGNVGTGQAWRLITSALLHGGWLHIIFNSLWIWSLGRAVESNGGSIRFTLIFLGSAAISSAAQWFFQAQQIQFGGAGLTWLFAGAGVGLSGVLYGLAGYLWMRRRVDAVAATIMNPYTARMLGAWFVICIVLPSMNIANWAHGGGLAWGLAAGWISTQRNAKALYALLAVATLAAVLLVSTGKRAKMEPYRMGMSPGGSAAATEDVRSLPGTDRTSSPVSR